ncbi:MAG TPA: hypothetical protein VFG50_11830 [Rhodothermales bacterium]|nr:hypothetical protein [Rhodothermales bacterium]
MRDSQKKLRLPGSATTSGRILYVALLGLLAYLCGMLAAGAGAADRAVYLRNWSILAAAGLALLPPNLLLPDSNVRFFQFLNLAPGKLADVQFRRWLPLVFLFVIPAAVLAYFAPGSLTAGLGDKSLYFLEALLITAGTALYSFAVYQRIGKRSQQWQEGERGEWYRSWERTTGQSYGVPHGLVPVFWVTSHVFVVGMVFALAGVYAESRLGVRFVWLPGLALVLLGSLRAGLVTRRFDVHFYRTNALYTEVFRTGGVRATDRSPIPYRAVYWTPERWKPHVWAGLRQLDRRLPLGRFVAIGHVILWLLFYREALAGLIAAYLLLFSLAKNTTVYLTAQEAMAPPPFQHLFQPPQEWVFIRFFVNLRWTLPYFLSLSLVAILTDRFNFVNVVSWTLLDVALAFVTAWMATLGAESPYRKRYA